MTIAWLGVLLELGGCTVGTFEDRCGDAPPDLVLGTGVDRDWVELAPGDQAQIIAGPQGGFHVDAAGLVSPMDKDTLLSGVLRVPRLANPVVSTPGARSRALANYDDPTCSGEFFGFQVVFETADLTRVCRLDGEEAEIEVTVEGIESGVTATESVRVRLRAPPTCR